MHRVEILSDEKVSLISASAGLGENSLIFFQRRKAMKKTNFARMLALFLCMVLIAATALFATGCKNSEKETPDTTDGQTTEADSTVDDTTADEGEGKTVLGEGATQFTFTVVDKDGKETVFEINTDKTTVGDALLELELISGDDGDYGLYVKTVNGITADYDTDGTYWAFYINGEYAMSGVDKTDVEAGAEYSFKVEK